jgi:hypothetical protein
VTKLRELIDALPECSAKATLRGIQVAAETLGDDGTQSDSLVRMSRLVRTWREDDPLTRLEAELEHLLAGNDSAAQRP